MSSTFKVGLASFAVIIILAVIVVSKIIGISNTERKMYQRGLAAQKNCEIVFDKTWKVIKGQASVTEQYKDAFKDVYIGMMDARYSDEGQGQETLMKWVQESNPNFDVSLYSKLMNTIEGSRNEFMMEQKILIDVDRELKTFKAIFPNNLIVGDRPDLEIKLVTSGKTKEAFSSGEENDVDVF